MHAGRWLMGVAWLAILALPGQGAGRPEDASGRREFPLKYRLACLSISEEVGYGGQVLPVGKQRPPALREELNYHSRHPLYATAHLGAGREAFALVLDSSTGADRGYDVLYVDADRDGRIGPAEKVAGIHRDNGVTFGPVKLMIDCGREKCPQWFLVLYAEYDQGPGREPYRLLQLINAGYYQGVVNFGGQKRLLAFADTNANGLYNDVLTGVNEGNSDRLLLDRNGDGRLDGSYQSEESQPLGRYVQVAGRYWRLDVAADGSAVTVAPLDRPLGTVRSDVADYTLLLGSQEGVLQVRSKDGSARVPAGKYRLLRCNYRVTHSGQCWQFSASARGGGSAIEVPAEATVKVPFGPPFVPKVQAAEAGADLGLSLVLRGAGGEVYDNVYRGGNYQRPPVPRARILDARDRELALLDFHYG
jgi:hypothetical protein